MIFLILIPIFFAAAYFSFYIPGSLILSYTFPALSKENRFISSWMVGIAFFLLFAYLLAWVHANIFLLILLIIIAGFSIWKKKDIFYIPKINDWFTFILILFGSLCFLGVTFSSGLKTNQGLQFVGVINVSDGLFHIANVKNLLVNFPPTHSAIAGIPLKGYHYFYDLLVSRFVLIYHFDPFDLHFRFFSLFISLMYGLTIYLIVSSITQKKAAIRFTVFFSFFAQSAATIVALFIPSVAAHSELGLVYPIELITNPAILLAISMLLVSIFLLTHVKTIYQGIILGVLLGVITETKVYAGIIGLGTMGTFLLFNAIKRKKISISLLVAFIVAGFLTAITFLPNNAGSGSLFYSPFFIYSVFMQEPPVNIWNWELKRRIFVMHNNIPHLAVLYVQAFVVFWFLALGSRVIFLLGFIKIFKKKFWSKDYFVLLLLAISIPIIIGSFFVQSVSIFDTKQFFWIAAALLGIPAGVMLGIIWEKIPKVFGIILTCFIIFMSWGGFYYHMSMFVFHPSTFVISNEQLKVFAAVSKMVDKHSFVVVASDVDKIYNGEDARGLYAAPLISAVTGIPVYYEHEPAQYKLENVYTQRKHVIENIEKALTTCKIQTVQSLLNKVGSKYLLTYPPYPCIGKIGNFRKQFVSNNFALYITE